MTLNAGVVGVQGDVGAHRRAFDRLGVDLDTTIDVSTIRRPGDVGACDLIAIPGGESTTISRLIRDQGLSDELTAHVDAGNPLLATCAGMIVAAGDPNDDRVVSLDLIDIAIERNAFGRQRESFQAAVDIAGLERPFPGVFIRAPAVTDPKSTTVLGTIDGHVVAVSDGPVTATAFHPELTNDVRIHRLAFADIGDGQ